MAIFAYPGSWRMPDERGYAKIPYMDVSVAVAGFKQSIKPMSESTALGDCPRIRGRQNLTSQNARESTIDNSEGFWYPLK
jgi:hypothetical protein